MTVFGICWCQAASKWKHLFNLVCAREQHPRLITFIVNACHSGFRCIYLSSQHDIITALNTRCHLVLGVGDARKESLIDVFVKTARKFCNLRSLFGILHLLPG